MRTAQAHELVERIRGFWPTPAMEEAEVRVWMDVLTDKARPLTFEAASTTVSRLAASEAFRPRPGQLVSLTRARLSHELTMNCQLCGGTTWRTVRDDELPCHRGHDCLHDVLKCNCQVRCTYCEGGKVPWQPEREPPPISRAPIEEPF